jgi:hypothetical protein
VPTTQVIRSACDRTDPEETSLAVHLSDAIRARESMHVFLPEVDKDPALLDEEHCSRLATCDGVLLYWGHGREEWCRHDERR